MAYNVLSGTIGDSSITSSAIYGTFYGDGANLVSTPGINTVATAADNRLITFTSTGGTAVQGEENLTFDGSTLLVNGTLTLKGTGSVSSLVVTGSVSSSAGATFASSISSSGDLAVTGNMHAAAYYGDGQYLENVSATLVSGTIVTATSQLVSVGTLEISGASTFAGSVSSSAGATFASSVSSSGDLAVTGNMHAAAYYGDGQYLSNVGAASVSGSDRHYSVTGLETSGYLRASGSMKFGVTTATSTGDISTAFSSYIIVSGGTSDITMTLPAVATTDQWYAIKRHSNMSGSVIVEGASSELIDNALNVTLGSTGAAVFVISDGNQWNIF